MNKHLLTIREAVEREAQLRTDAFRHAVLLAVVFATLLLTGLLNGCASEMESQMRALQSPEMTAAICAAGAMTKDCGR